MCYLEQRIKKKFYLKNFFMEKYANIHKNKSKTKNWENRQ